jgi:hypothetical protein
MQNSLRPCRWKKFDAMEAHLAKEEACIEYSDPIELELHSEQEREVHMEITR